MCYENLQYRFTTFSQGHHGNLRSKEMSRIYYTKSEMVVIPGRENIQRVFPPKEVCLRKGLGEVYCDLDIKEE